MRPTHHARHRCAQNADHFATSSPFSVFFTEVVCDVGATPLQTTAAPPPSGGNCSMRGATRRQHADSQLLMLQNPHHHWHGAHRRDPRARLGCRWVAEARQLNTRKVPRRNKSRPARAARPNFRYKTLPAHPLAPHVRDKTLPACPPSPHFRYKTLPAHPKWPNLAQSTHAGRVLYRSHHQEAKQGEFCTERGAETGLANTTGHQAPPVWRVPEGPVWRARAGFEAQSLAAVPVDNGARPQ